MSDIRSNDWRDEPERCRPGDQYSGMPPSEAVLLVDDDTRLTRLMEKFLTEYGFKVLLESNGRRAVHRIRRERPTLVVLDIMLPGADGLSVCRSVRPEYQGPILMLTALGDDVDEVAGLELGADDYLTKPVRPRVLLARIRALLRRMPATTSPPATGALDSAQGAQTRALPGKPGCPLEIGPLRIVGSARTAALRGRDVHLTSAEFDLLWLLGIHAGRTLTRDTIRRRLCGLEYDGLDRSIDLRVSRIRRKLGDDPRRPTLIKSVRGVGYMLANVPHQNSE